MNRNEIMFVLNCCLWCLDNTSKEQLMKHGATEEEAQMGIQLCDYLKNKEMEIEIENGY